MKTEIKIKCEKQQKEKGTGKEKLNSQEKQKKTLTTKHNKKP